MKRNIALISMIWMVLLGAFQAYGARNDDRAKWMDEMRRFKRSYFTKELDLTTQQQNRFFPLYEEMEDQVQKIDGETRQMERRVAELKNASDLEYQKATEAIYDGQVRQAEIEREYVEKFQSILSRKQIFKIKAVERQFNRELMKQHRRLHHRNIPAER